MDYLVLISAEGNIGKPLQRRGFCWNSCVEKVHGKKLAVELMKFTNRDNVGMI